MTITNDSLRSIRPDNQVPEGLNGTPPVLAFRHETPGSLAGLDRACSRHAASKPLLDRISKRRRDGLHNLHGIRVCWPVHADRMHRDGGGLYLRVGHNGIDDFVYRYAAGRRDGLLPGDGRGGGLQSNYSGNAGVRGERARVGQYDCAPEAWHYNCSCGCAVK